VNLGQDVDGEGRHLYPRPLIDTMVDDTSNPTDTGMSRLTLSDDDKKVRDWFVETTRSLGCKVTVDAMGNIFAIRPGRLDGPPTLVGSHLDTQPTGGRYDGILGVQAGIEMLKILEEHDVETEFPVGVVNWTKYVSFLLHSINQRARF
jgi:hypothetical protein